MLIIFAVLATSRGRFSTVNLDLPPDQNLPPIFTAPSCGDDPNGCRSLWDIIWSCLSTMFLCTWVVIHPNIPGPEEPWTKVALRRVGIVTATLIAPEIILSWAVRQLIVAVKLAKKHKDQEWTVTHGFFAVMGGFMAFEGDKAVKTLLPDGLGGYSLTGNDVFPKIPREDIEDKSKGDIISKGLVVMQTGWFMMQCLTRKVEHLPITELELVTIAYAVLNIFLYAIWWYKPLNVQTAVRVYLKPGFVEPSSAIPSAEHGEGNEEEDDGLNWKEILVSLSGGLLVGFCLLAKTLLMVPIIPIQIVWQLLTAIRKHRWRVIWLPISLLLEAVTGTAGDVEDEKRIGTFYPESAMAETGVAITGTLVATLFGAIHCIAWSFTFPTKVERDLWRVAAVLITSLPLPYVLLIKRFHYQSNVSFLAVVAIFFPLVYILSRLSLLVLPFLSLRALPLDIYQSVYWPILIPHLY